jgi:long-chain acyl-CoA synthetase
MSATDDNATARDTSPDAASADWLSADQIDATVDGRTVAGRFLANLDRRPDTEVLRWKTADGEWRTQTLASLADDVARLATALGELGVGPGDRVVLMLRNRPEFHAIDLACLFRGATPVSIYNSSAPDQVEYLVNHCGATVAIVEDDGFRRRFDARAGVEPTLTTMVIVDPSEETPADVLRYHDLLQSPPADLRAAATMGSPDDLATIIYTSGTTGPPKGVMLTNRNVCWALESLSCAMRVQAGLDELGGYRHVSYLPMAHIMERLLGHYYLVEFATQVTCCPDTAQVAAYAAEVHPQFFTGVPRVWEKLHAGVEAALAGDDEKATAFHEAVAAAEPIAERVHAGEATAEEVETYEFLDAVAFTPVKQLLGLDQTVICISGAAPLPAEILRWFRTVGVPLSEGYGLSETMAMMTWSHRAKPGYVGRPAPGVEVRLADDGEVLTRGGNTFAGYLDAPEQSAETIDADGWVHTGDIGELDDDGYLRIIDRKKELIITAGGKNVSPANLEAALKLIPLVGQACVIGDQRPFVSALVVLDPDAARAWAASQGLTGDAATPAALANDPDVVAEIESGVIEAMSTFNNAESVKRVTVLGDEWLPDSDLLTPTSKLKRRGIHARFAAEIEAMYAS